MAFRTNIVPAIEERTVSGSSVSFNSAFALPLKACKVSFSATQSGTGNPSPTNVRPISGVSSITLGANGSVTVIDLDGTRYGGYVANDKLVLTHRGFIITENINVVLMSTQSGNQTFYFGAGNAVANTAISNLFSRNITSNDEGYMVHTVSQIYGVIDTSRLNPVSSAGMKQWLIDNNAIFVYEYANPIEISLSDIPTLSTIIGNNTFSTDTGTLEITFSDLQEKSASGSVATFNTALAMPLASCNVAVNAWQEGSGDPSPSNVRPIHGFSEVNAIRSASVNLLPFYNDIDFTKNKIRYYTQNGNLYLDGTSQGETSSSDVVFRNNFDFYLNKGTYTMSRQYGSMYVYKFVGDTIAQIASNSSPTFTLTERTHCFIGFYVYQTTYDNLMQGGQINVGSSALPYEPCSPKTTYTIQLGQEVYGAEVDVVNGVAHVTHGFVVFDGSEDWGEYGSAGFQSGVYSSLKLGNRQEGMANWLITTGTVNQFGFIIGLNNKKFYATHIKENISEVIDVTSWKQYLGEHPLQVVYPLAEPFDIQLTPQQIETLIGNNTIFADTGDVDLTYKDLDIAKRGSFREVFKLP